MKFLIVVDMQNDFITGSLKSAAAEAIVPRVREKVENFKGEIIFTRDTHYENYLKTSEGKKLPVEHCIKNSKGWQICDELMPYAENITDKETFGSLNLLNIILKKAENKAENIEEIELCGLCTDICVISNAMILKAAFPEASLKVNSSLCAGVSEESHNTALKAMAAVQIDII